MAILTMEDWFLAIKIEQDTRLKLQTLKKMQEAERAQLVAALVRLDQELAPVQEAREWGKAILTDRQYRLLGPWHIEPTRTWRRGASMSIAGSNSHWGMRVWLRIYKKWEDSPYMWAVTISNIHGPGNDLIEFGPPSDDTEADLRKYMIKTEKLLEERGYILTRDEKTGLVLST